jgi:hypothetical protein
MALNLVPQRENDGVIAQVVGFEHGSLVGPSHRFFDIGKGHHGHGIGTILEPCHFRRELLKTARFCKIGRKHTGPSPRRASRRTRVTG